MYHQNQTMWGIMEALIVRTPPILFLWLSGIFLFAIDSIDYTDLKNIVAAIGSIAAATMAILRHLKDKRLEKANEKLSEELEASRAKLTRFESEREKFREEIRQRVQAVESTQVK